MIFDFSGNTARGVRYDYEKDEHSKLIGWDKDKQPCLHDGCHECHGTGRRRDGGACFHMISCSCPKCSPR